VLSITAANCVFISISSSKRYANLPTLPRYSGGYRNFVKAA
jgi:hypothetical protein